MAAASTNRDSSRVQQKPNSLIFRSFGFFFRPCAGSRDAYVGSRVDRRRPWAPVKTQVEPASHQVHEELVFWPLLHDMGDESVDDGLPVRSSHAALSRKFGQFLQVTIDCRRRNVARAGVEKGYGFFMLREIGLHARCAAR